MDRLHQIIDLLQKQERDLQDLVLTLEKQQKHSLPGSLVISGRDSRKCYYYRAAPGQAPSYLSKKTDTEQIHKLAQQDYGRDLLSAAKHQLLSVRKSVAYLSGQELEKIYGNMVPARKELTDPLFPDPERFARDWASVTYPPGHFEENVPEFFSERGERVRSKSEKIIADKYYHLDSVLYRYEYPLTLRVNDRQKVFRPDFMLLNKRTCKIYYHQHLGRMDDPVYVSDNLYKLRIFEQNGIFLGEQLFFTYETQKMPFDARMLDPLIKRYLL